LTLQCLEGNNWTNQFFSWWFSSIDSFTRVHDKKLSIAAIVSLLTLNSDQVPISVQQGWPRLLQGIVRLFQTLPAATKNREEALKDDFPLDGRSLYWDRLSALSNANTYEIGSGYGDDDDDDEWGGDDSAWTEEAEPEDEADGKDESSAYLEFLNEEVSSELILL